MRAGIAKTLAVAYVMFELVFKLCQHGATFDLVVAGLSSSRGPDSFLICDHDRYGGAAWSVIPLGPVCIAPADEETLARMALTEAELAGDIDPVEDGLRIIEAQRHCKAIQGEETEPSYGVGGFAQLTTVRAGEITTRILRRWPDRIGEKLGQIGAA